MSNMGPAYVMTFSFNQCLTVEPAVSLRFIWLQGYYQINKLPYS